MYASYVFDVNFFFAGDCCHGRRVKAEGWAHSEARETDWRLENWVQIPIGQAQSWVRKGLG